VSLLEITVETGTSGPVMKLSGECDVTNTGQLKDAIGAQLADGVRHLVIDLAGLGFAESMTIKVFIDTQRALKATGGTLELLRPKGAVARSLRLLGVGQLLTIRTEAGTGDQPMNP
jgi:stage II sporulation protein AA (anti-sigma F factor antagonist)